MRFACEHLKEHLKEHSQGEPQERVSWTSVFLLCDFEMKSRAEDSLSIKNKEAKNHFLRKVCKRVSSLPAASVPPATKLRMSGTFCAQPEESTPDLLRSRKIGILWSGGLGAAARWLSQTEGRRSKGAALFWVCSWSNQSCWLTCISILKVQANKFLKGWKGYISSN